MLWGVSIHLSSSPQTLPKPRYVYTFAAQRSYFLLSPDELDSEMSRAGHTDVEFAVKLQAALASATADPGFALGFGGGGGGSRV